jgi:transcription elongation factor Elf1
MASMGRLRQFTCTARCVHCGHELTDLLLSKRVDANELRQVFNCSNCDYEFEMVIHTDDKQPLPAKLAEEFLPDSLVTYVYHP